MSENRQPMMSKSNNEPLVKLSYDNWYIWDFQIKSTILRKNAYVAFDPEPVNPCAQQQVSPAGSTGSTTIPSITVSHTPTAEELKTYCKEHKEWKTARNITAGVITWFDIEGVTAYNHSRPTSKDYV